MLVLKSKYIKSIDRQLEQLNTIEQLKNTISKLQAERDSNWLADVQHASFALDFDKMNAFSIERMADMDKPRTIVGFIKSSGEVSEWVLYCSAEMHEELVLQFNVYRNKVVIHGNK